MNGKINCPDIRVGEFIVCGPADDKSVMPQIRGGEIMCDHNLFGDIIDQYWLFYPGKHRVSGKDCNRRVKVTKEKYTKEMYGE